MGDIQREQDLVLNPNEYAYVLDKTKGLISCVVGPYKMSLSTSDATVVFNETTKRFEETSSRNAIKTFVTAPENWYIVLKNPSTDNSVPSEATANVLPKLNIGKKVNIRGNASFALYPGQMAKTIQGHRLHSNQYLLARVYDASTINKDIEKNSGDSDAAASAVYENGQMIVIKGTDVSFYIPPTGIEVVPKGGKGSEYVRDAVTLERLEYCILLSESGEKKYIHGPAVVFPQPDEKFVKNHETNGYKFKAIELTETSGIYVKVVQDYTENGKKHVAGEELFITGRDQMIYYPRAEHAIITYNGKTVHHAIAIPEGEGRYVLERRTGKIKTVRGASMYLVNPIDEVVVQRKLTPKQCKLWFPDNSQVLAYNNALDTDDNGVPKNSHEAEKRRRGSVAKDSIFGNVYEEDDEDSVGMMDASYSDPFDSSDAVTDDSGFSRSNSYTKPRTIIIDNKYSGVVSIDVWTGYAVNVVSKSGSRKVIQGPKTYMLDYDEYLEEIQMSTGKPKTTDTIKKDVYLHTENNKVCDIITVQTKDFVNLNIKLSYCVDFSEAFKEKWFKVENYVKYLCDRMRSILKRKVKGYNLEDFYNNAYDIIRNTVLGIDEESGSDKLWTEGTKSGRMFTENGMFIHDVDILTIRAEDDVQKMLDDRQIDAVEQTLKLSAAEQGVKIREQIAETEKRKAEIEYDVSTCADMYRNQLQAERQANEHEMEMIKRKNEEALQEAKKRIQPLLDSISASVLARESKQKSEEIDYKKKINNLEAEKQTKYMEAISKLITSISPELVAAMDKASNAEIVTSLAESMSPYAIAQNSSVVDVTDKLLRGTTLEELLGKLKTSH